MALEQRTLAAYRRCFDSIDELLVQMKADVDGARRLLSTDPG